MREEDDFFDRMSEEEKKIMKLFVAVNEYYEVTHSRPNRRREREVLDKIPEVKRCIDNDAIVYADLHYPFNSCGGIEVRGNGRIEVTNMKEFKKLAEDADEIELFLPKAQPGTVGLTFVYNGLTE